MNYESKNKNINFLLKSGVILGFLGKTMIFFNPELFILFYYFQVTNIYFTLIKTICLLGNIVKINSCKILLVFSKMFNVYLTTYNP